MTIDETSRPELVPDGLMAAAPLFNYQSFDVPQRTQLEIYLNDHSNEKDMGEPGELHDIIAAADIFIPELVGWGEPIRRQLQQISDGNRKVCAELQQEWGSYNNRTPTSKVPFLRELLTTKVKIGLADLQPSHRLFVANDALYRRNRFNLRGDESFDAAVAKRSAYTDHYLAH